MVGSSLHVVIVRAVLWRARVARSRRQSFAVMS